MKSKNTEIGKGFYISAIIIKAVKTTTKVKVCEIENREMVQTRTDWEKELKTLGKGEALVIPLNKLTSVRKRLRDIEGLEYSKNTKKNEAYVNFSETDKETKPTKKQL